MLCENVNVLFCSEPMTRVKIMRTIKCMENIALNSRASKNLYYSWRLKMIEF